MGRVKGGVGKNRPGYERRPADFFPTLPNAYLFSDQLVGQITGNPECPKRITKVIHKLNSPVKRKQVKLSSERQQKFPEKGISCGPHSRTQNGPHRADPQVTEKQVGTR